MKVKGRAAVIGAGGCIGHACMTVFSDAGWEPIGADLQGGSGLFELDVTDETAVNEFAKTADADVLVYAAGLVATMPVIRTDFSVWRKVLAVNLDGAAHAVAAFARTMIKRGNGGSMVFLSSAAGVRGEGNASAYSASKAGLIGLIESAAAELVPYSIRINAVAPGNVDTPMLRTVARDIAREANRMEEDVLLEMAHTGAANRLVTPIEVAHVCASLCSKGFSAVTGVTVPVDAGYLLS